MLRALQSTQVLDTHWLDAYFADFHTRFQSLLGGEWLLIGNAHARIRPSASVKY
jgi:hypothetical protein